VRVGPGSSPAGEGAANEIRQVGARDWCRSRCRRSDNGFDDANGVITTAPTIDVTPANGPAGTPVNVSGADVSAGDTITVT
jgi:hypothetical protein